MDNLKYMILDFGKVLAGPTTGHWFMTPKFLELVGKVSDGAFQKALALNQEYLDAVMNTEQEEYEMFVKFYDGVLRVLGYSNSSLDWAKKIAWDFTYQSDKYTFYEGIEQELEELSSKYCLLMLTDNWPCVFRILKERNLDKYFEKIYVSSVYGEKKENGVFFDFPIQDYSIQEGEALFIDDNEQLLDVAVKKKLRVKLMDREKEVTESKYPIISDLKDLV